ncbi:MAG: hypothetical protein RBR16_13735 [Syntrophus sp. (in: bacteria)]|nr:hypothetical protein [Syntrophus sp. (in: bacteria)]
MEKTGNRFLDRNAGRVEAEQACADRVSTGPSSRRPGMRGR